MELRLAQSVEPVILDVRAMSSNLTLGVRLLKKGQINNNRKMEIGVINTVSNSCSDYLLRFHRCLTILISLQFNIIEIICKLESHSF